MSEPQSTTGAASLRKAYAGAFTSSAPAAAGSLAEAYRLWKARQADAERTMSPVTRAALVAPDEIERHALRKGARRVEKRMKRGQAPAKALASGHRRYRKHGGSASFAGFVRKLRQA